MTTFKLPEPEQLWEFKTTKRHGPFLFYTEAQLTQALRDVLEQAAKRCESMQAGWSSDHHIACAEAIRKMIGEIK